MKRVFQTFRWCSWTQRTTYYRLCNSYPLYVHNYPVHSIQLVESTCEIVFLPYAMLLYLKTKNCVDHSLYFFPIVLMDPSKVKWDPSKPHNGWPPSFSPSPLPFSPPLPPPYNNCLLVALYIAPYSQDQCVTFYSEAYCTAPRKCSVIIFINIIIFMIIINIVILIIITWCVTLYNVFSYYYVVCHII